MTRGVHSGEQYRKLTAEELTARGITGTSVPHHLEPIVKKYYNLTNAVTGILSCNAEYNDEGYDCHGAYLIVLDKDGNEIPPIQGKSKEVREEVNGVAYSIFGGMCENNDEGPSDINFNFKTPELYIKV